MDKSKKDIPSLLEDSLRHLPADYDLKECVFDWTSEETSDVLLYQEDGKKVMFTRENLSLIAGPEKSGKTFLTNILAATCLGKPLMGLLTDKRDLKVAIFDTEQGGAYIRKTVARTFKLLEWKPANNPRYKHFNLIYYNPEERLAIIQFYIGEFKPDVVIIDGIVDLVDDFNNNIQSSKVVTILNAIAAKNNCHVCGILHTNKSDDNARGHIGSIFQQKCETVIKIKYVREGLGGYMVVEAGSCRNEPFNTFYFRIQGKDADAIPVYFGSPIPEDPKITRYKCIHDLFYKNKNDPMPAMDLNRSLQALLGKGSSTISALVRQAKEDGVLVEMRHGTSIRYSLARFEDRTQHKEEEVFNGQ